MPNQGQVEPRKPSDEDLLCAAGHDPEAFAELYRRHVGRMVAFAVRRCSRAAEVPDLVAAVWLEVIDCADRFDPKRGRALPWLLGIAANLVSSENRRRMRERQAMERLAGRRVLDEDDFQRLESAIDAASAAPDIWRAIAGLPAGERAVVELVVVEGLTPDEAARALDLRPAAARMRLVRARRKLRAALGHGSDDDVLPWAVEKVIR